MISALRAANICDRTVTRVLDVGCGAGASLLRFVGMGFEPSNLYGVDIMDERIREARARLPGLKFSCADATALPFESNSFDLVLESTMFVQLTDEALAQKIAAEMLRVTKKNGHLLLIDWRYSKPGSADYRGLSMQRLKRLFAVPTDSCVEFVSPGSLVPPIGRRISRSLPSLYFLLEAVFPILAGQTATLLRRL